LLGQAIVPSKVARFASSQSRHRRDLPLRVLADKASLQFVMKEGKIVASHAGSELPKELFAKQVLSIV
jgi:hypothetical protein